MRGSARGLAVCAAAATVMACSAAPASADLPTLLSAANCSQKDGLDNDTGNGTTLPFKFCNDGVPAAAGGATPNSTAQSAIEVPSAYTGIGGLPLTDVGETVPGEDPVDNTVALDVDVSLPDPTHFAAPPAGDQYPVVVMMHGCCSGSKTSWEGPTIDPGGPENWHYNNAWFASRGYIVVNYTARGFVDGSNRGSTGETQLDSAKYEINDYQHLVGQLADADDLDPDVAKTVKVDPQRIVPTGGSYGGGFTWLALTDPTWNSPGLSTPMKVVAAGTKYGWTNLVESLVPRGDDRRDALPQTNPATVKSQLQTTPGFPKRSINAALYASGKTGVPPGSPHTTFPMAIDNAQACLISIDPFPSNPLCTTTLNSELGRFIDERSAYFQTTFFDGLQASTIDPVPVFSAGTFTDKLFPAAEHRRMVERLKQVSPGYPVQEYYGDYNHFVQTKRKEFADVCGADHHVCTYDDYPGPAASKNLNADPASRSLERGVTSRLNRFIDHYAAPPANTGEDQPDFDVTGALQVCPDNAASLGRATDEPGLRFTAGTFATLGANTLKVTAPGAQATVNPAGANPHAKKADPVGNLATNDGACVVESSPGGLASAGPGVATYDSQALPSDFTMLGQARLVVSHTGVGPANQLNARLYDLGPGGKQVMVDRGVKRITSPMGPTTLDLHGAGWRFAAGHKLRIEVTQDDDPYIKSSTLPSSLTLSGVTLDVPVREGSASVGGGATPAPGGSGGGAGTAATSHPDFRPTVSPDGRLVAFTRSINGNRDIWLVNSNGTGLRRVTSGTPRDDQASFSPGGSRLAFARRRNGNTDVHTVRLDGSGLRRLTRSQAPDADPAWSRGGRIAFTRRRGRNHDLFLMRANGTRLRRLTRTRASEGEPAFSRRGRIAFIRGRDVFIMRSNGRRVRRLTRTRAPESSPVFSRSGRLAFVRRRRGNLDLYVMRSDGSRVRRVTGASAPDRHPAFTPGGRLVFDRPVAGDLDLYVVGTNGRGLRRLTSG